MGCPDPSLDPDCDGITEADNCPFLYNPEQCDSNMDGLGNRCDFDFDNDFAIDLQDFLELLAQRQSYATQPGWDPTFDANCDGAVEDTDVFLFLDQCEQGPSAVTIGSIEVSQAYLECQETMRILLPEPNGLLFGVLLVSLIKRILS